MQGQRSHVFFALFILLAFFLITPVKAQEKTTTETELQQKINAAQKALVQKSYIKAIQLYMDWLSQNKAPTDNKAEIYHQLGQAFYGAKLYALALNSYTEAEQRYTPETLPVELHYYMAWSAYLIKDIEQSQGYLKQVLNHPALPLELKQSAESLLMSTIKDTSSNYKDGLQAYQEGRYQYALQKLKLALKKLPESQEINLYIGASHYQLNEFDQARPFLQKVLSNDPESAAGQKSIEILSVIETLSNKLETKPFNLSIDFGPQLNTNLNLGGSLRAGQESQAPLQGGGGLLHINASQQILPDTKLSYDLNLNAYYNNTQNNTLKPSQFNRQIHALSLHSQYFLKDIFQVRLSTLSNIDILGNDLFQFNSELRPTLTIFETNRLVSQVGLFLGAGVYPSVPEWSNTRFGLDLSQYIYLWNSQTWLRFFYQYRNVKALDFIKTSINETGRLETDKRRANSRSNHQIGLSMHFPLGPPTLEIGSFFTFSDYLKTEVYREFLTFNDPRTGLNLPRQNDFSRQFEALRQDTSLHFFARLEVPLSEQWKLKAQYKKTTNTSNILPEVIPFRNYNYIIDEFVIKFQYSL